MPAHSKEPKGTPALKQKSGRKPPLQFKLKLDNEETITVKKFKKGKTGHNNLIPLSTITEKGVQTVLKWAGQKEAEQVAPNSDANKSGDLSDTVNHVVLLELTRFANYLDVRERLETEGLGIAALIFGDIPSEIKGLLGLPE